MGKTLVIDARSTGDWSLDLLFAGLVTNLGYENVIDFPARQKHRMGKPVLVGDPEKDWGAERMSLSYTPDHHRLPVWSAEEIVVALKKGEIDRIFLDEREESFRLYCSLRANFFDVPVVVVAGHDRFNNKSPEWVRQNYYPKTLEMMFLDNWRPEYDVIPWARHYSLSINFDHLWDVSKRSLCKNKVFDLCFMGYNSNMSRVRYVEHIQKKWGHLNNHIMLETKPNTFSNFSLKNEYFDVIAQSKICLNFKGDAEDGRAMRFFEIPYVGSYMLSERFRAQKYQIDPIPCAYFSDTDELDIKIEAALAEPVAREEIAKICHEVALSKNTSHQRVRYMLQELNG